MTTPARRSADIRELTDARTLRALTHPVRVAMIEELIHGGAMTATELGERIGETPTTCSFHLRQLAKYAFVEEAGGGQGRSRPWRTDEYRLVVHPRRRSGDGTRFRCRAADVPRAAFARYETWRRTRGIYPPQWRQASDDSEYLFYLTADELAQLGTELQEVLMRWRQLEGRLEDPPRRPPDSLPVESLLFSFPINPPASTTPPASTAARHPVLPVRRRNPGRRNPGRRNPGRRHPGRPAPSAPGATSAPPRSQRRYRTQRQKSFKPAKLTDRGSTHLARRGFLVSPSRG